MKITDEGEMRKPPKKQQQQQKTKTKRKKTNKDRKAQGEQKL